MKKEYVVMISGDDYLEGHICIEESKMESFLEIVAMLRPDGPYAPRVIVEDVEEAKRAAEQNKKHREEEQRKNLEHAMGLDVKSKTAFQIAYEKAMGVSK